MLVGSTSKETTDLARVVIDFLEWLDPGEAVASTTTPVVAVDTTGAWSQMLPANPPVVPVDTTPLTVSSTTMADANTKLIVLLAAGTPGLVYLVSFIATGSTSTRRQTIEFRVAVQAAP
jgi:hypothetical protein